MRSRGKLWRIFFSSWGSQDFSQKLTSVKATVSVKPVAIENVSKTAFVTSDGACEFLRGLFGTKNSGATLVPAMRKILSGMSGVESYST